jgi:hypothetical protein
MPENEITEACGLKMRDTTTAGKERYGASELPLIL